jgi:translocation and assembly module TamB
MVRRIGRAALLAALVPLLMVVVLIGLGVALLGLAQTPLGQRLLVAELERMLAGPEGEVRIEGLRGRLPFDVQLDSLTMADAEGDWLELQDARLAWSAAALLRGRVEVERIEAAELRLERLPAGAPDDAAQDTPFRLPELPRHLPPVTLDRLHLAQIALGPEVLGAPAVFALTGRIAAAEDGKAADLALELARIDQPTADIALDARLALDPPALDLRLTGSETGGLLAAALGRPELGRLELALEGSGPLAGWAGRLTAVAEGLGDADLALRLAAVEPLRLAIDGPIRPAPGLLPPALAGLVGDGVDLALAASRRDAQIVEIETMRARLAKASLEAAGTVDLDAQRLDLRAALAAPDLAAAGAGLGLPLAGSATLDATASGPLRQPAGRLELQGERLRYAPLDLQRATVALDWQALAPLDGADAQLRLAGTGHLDGLALDAAPLPERALDLDLAAEIPLQGEVELERLRIAGEHLALTAAGRLDPAALAGAATVALDAARLGPLAAPYDAALEGRASLRAEVAIAPGAATITTDLSGELAELKGLPPAATALLGPRLTLAGRAVLEPAAALRLEGLRLAGTAAQIAGDVQLGLAGEQALAGTLTLDLPQLDRLRPALGQDLAGGLTLKAALAGRLDAPEVTLDGAGQAVRLAGRALDPLTLRASARDLLTAPAGTVALRLGSAGLSATLESAYRLEGEALQLADLVLDAPGSTVTGAAAIDLAGPLVEGRLAGRIGRIEAFAPLLPLPVAGSGALDLQLTPRDGRQDVAATLDLRALAGEFGSLGQARLRARIADTLGTPQLDASLTAQDFTQGTITLARLTGSARGGLDALRIEADAEGEALQPLTLSTALDLKLADPLTVRLDRLTGSYAGEPLRLARPATVTLGAVRAQLAGLDLRLGAAELRGDVTLGVRDLTGQVRLADLPLAWAARFGGPPLIGQARADLRLGGRANAPRADLALVVDGVRVDRPTLAELPPAELRANLRLADRRLDLDLRTSGLTDRPVTAQIRAPVALALRPFAFDLPSRGALSGQVRGELQLARLVDLLALEEQRLAGRLATDLRLGGTVGAPALTGTIALADGGYENDVTGTVLRELAARASATERAVTLETLTGRVGDSGRLRGEGWATLDPAASWPMSLEVTLQNAPMVRRDDIDATLSGSLSVAGNLTALRAGGRITVDQAEVGIPSGSGPDVPVIQIEVAGAEPAAADQAAAAPPLDPELNLAIDAPARVYVRGRGLESEWRGQLTIRGRASAPVVVGNLEVVRGYFDFLDRRFELAEGTIDFDGSVPPNPILSLRATAEANDLTVVVRLAGPAKDPQITLESEPAMPEDEVLARLLFNREVSEISPTEAAKLALAVNRLRGGGGFDLFAELRDILRVDRLDIVSGDTPAESAVRAGKYLSDDIYVEVEKGAAGTSGKARVEVEILPNVAVEAETREDGTGGVGVKWKLDY